MAKKLDFAKVEAGKLEFRIRPVKVQDYRIPFVDHLRDQLVGDTHKVRLFTCITKHKTVFLWPARMPDAEAGGAGLTWHKSGLEVAELAKKNGAKKPARRTRKPKTPAGTATTNNAVVNAAHRDGNCSRLSVGVSTRTECLICAVVSSSRQKN